MLSTRHCWGTLRSRDDKHVKDVSVKVAVEREKLTQWSSKLDL